MSIFSSFFHFIFPHNLRWGLGRLDGEGTADLQLWRLCFECRGFNSIIIKFYYYSLLTFCCQVFHDMKFNLYPNQLN